MTREEAIEELERLLSHWDDLENGKRSFRWYSKDAVGLAITALRPVSRERVEKVWRGCEWCNGEHSNNGEISAYAEVECDGCDAGDDCPNSHSSEDPCYGLVDRALPVNFCPVCGKPKTDEAVDMVMERLEDLHEEN